MAFKGALLLAALAAMVAAALAAAPVDPQLAWRLQSKGAADAFVCVHPIVSAEAANLEGKRAKLAEMTRPERRQFARDIRVLIAKESQAELIAALRAERNVRFESLWIVNCVFVRDATPVLIERLASLPSVRNIVGNNVAGVIDPVRTTNVRPHHYRANAVEWNIAKIEADLAWNTTRGEGVTVAGIDTGVRWTHETLIDSYRGYLGNGNADHNYNWFDPKEFQNDPWWCDRGTCSPSWECCAEEPFDNNSHGTHTMGTIAGSSDFGIGVAPGVSWIAAKGCRDGSCLDYGLTTSAQWVICPTDLEGNNEDCSRGADIVSNSWGGGQGDEFYMEWTQAWADAGMVVVFSNGNSGPRCGTSGSPADHENVIGVAATDDKDSLADFSSRGPAVKDSDGFSSERPNIAAPGVDIYSATSLVGSTDNQKYSTKSGTSMACPHVTGVAALMLSVNPSLTPEEVTELLQQTADQDLAAPDNGRTGSDECGGVHYGTYPNYHYGHGRVNARRAVEAARLFRKH